MSNSTGNLSKGTDDTHEPNIKNIVTVMKREQEQLSLNLVHHLEVQNHISHPLHHPSPAEKQEEGRPRRSIGIINISIDDKSINQLL